MSPSLKLSEARACWQGQIGPAATIASSRLARDFTNPIYRVGEDAGHDEPEQTLDQEEGETGGDSFEIEL